MRKINIAKLRECLSRVGIANVSIKTRISVHTLNRMSTPSYMSVPNPSTRMLLCSAFEIDEDELFPVVSSEAG